MPCVASFADTPAAQGGDCSLKLSCSTLLAVHDCVGSHLVMSADLTPSIAGHPESTPQMVSSTSGRLSWNCGNVKVFDSPLYEETSLELEVGLFHILDREHLHAPLAAAQLAPYPSGQPVPAAPHVAHVSQSCTGLYVLSTHISEIHFFVCRVARLGTSRSSGCRTAESHRSCMACLASYDSRPSYVLDLVCAAWRAGILPRQHQSSHLVHTCGSCLLRKSQVPNKNSKVSTKGTCACGRLWSTLRTKGHATPPLRLIKQRRSQPVGLSCSLKLDVLTAVACTQST